MSGRTMTRKPLYPWGRNYRYSMNKKLGQPQSLPGRCGEDENLQPTAQSYTDCVTCVMSVHLITLTAVRATQRLMMGWLVNSE